MSVYVDQLQDCVANNRWRYARSCHLVADTLDELHAFAERLGLKRAWFQATSLPHYDLTKNKRELAVKRGAIQIDQRQLVEILRTHRKKAAS